MEQDYTEAMKWFQRAAAQNSTSAMRAIAHMYEEGLGTSQNFGTAYAWYDKAAKLGDAEAQKAVDAYDSQAAENEAAGQQ